MAVEENIVIKVAVDTAESQNTLQGLEDSIDELKQLRDGQQIGSKAFNELSASIQKAEARIKDVELQFESLDFEQKLTAGTDAVTGLAGGFMVAEGAANLMGIQSESLEKSLQKMAAAMSLTMGLRDLANGVIALRKFGAAQKVAAVAQRVFNAAMSANPIGAIIVAITALTAAVYGLIKLFQSFNQEFDAAAFKQEKFNEATLKAKQGIAGQIVEMESLVAVAKDENASMEARQKAIDKLNETAPEYLGNLNLQNIATEEGTKMLDDYADALLKTAKAQAMQEQIVELYKKKIELETKAAEDAMDTSDKFAEGLTTGFAAVIDYSLGGLTDLTGAVDDAADSLAKQRQAEKISDVQAKIDAMKELVKETKGNSLAVEATADAYEEEAESAKKAADAKDKLAEAARKEAEEREKILKMMREESALIEKLTIDREGALDQYQKLLAIEVEATRTAATDEAAVEEEKFDFLSAMGAAYAQGETERIEQVRADAIAADTERQKGLDKAQQGIEFLGLVNNAFIKDEEKREKIRKALAVAQIAVDTARGISAAVAAGAGVPFPANIPAIISGVSAVLAGIVQAKGVLGSSDATPSVEGAISGASAGGGGVPLNNISNTASLVDQQQQEMTTQVVVLESDITTTQENVTTVSELSSF
jgi:hypothetical protein